MKKICLMLIIFCMPWIVKADTLYTTANVNLRSAPIMADNIIEVIDVNTEVSANTEQINNGFYYVEINDQHGYMSIDYLVADPVYEYLGTYKVTGYKMFDPSENGGRSDGLTASSVIGEPGHTVAMKDIDFGTEIYIKGLGTYVVEDRGVGPGVVDVACWTRDECYALTGEYEVYIKKE